MQELKEIPKEITNLFPDDGTSDEFKLPSGNVLWVKCTKQGDASLNYRYHLLKKTGKDYETYFGPRGGNTADDINNDWAIYGYSQAAVTSSGDPRKK